MGDTHLLARATDKAIGSTELAKYKGIKVYSLREVGEKVNRRGRKEETKKIIR